MRLAVGHIIKLQHDKKQEQSGKCIIESVDSISRDGPDTSIYVIHYKSPKNSALINYQDFKLIHS